MQYKIRKIPNKSKILFNAYVDIGTYTAIAYFNRDGIHTTQFTTDIPFSNTVPFLETMATRFRSRLRALTYDNKLYSVTFEMPELWSSSAKSMASASQGYLFTLSALVGYYGSTCMSLDIPVHLITPSEWKGHLSKEATAYRVQLITGRTFSSDHVCDAVAMGLSSDKDIWNLKKKFTKSGKIITEL